jgi:hypothetical protein
MPLKYCKSIVPTRVDNKLHRIFNSNVLTIKYTCYLEKNQRAVQQVLVF